VMVLNKATTFSIELFSRFVTEIELKIWEFNI
jgi:hypothetical protein